RTTVVNINLPGAPFGDRLARRSLANGSVRTGLGSRRKSVGATGTTSRREGLVHGQRWVGRSGACVRPNTTPLDKTPHRWANADELAPTTSIARIIAFMIALTGEPPPAC